MKHLKSKLTAAIVMVAISALMLTGVSFAWYTLSTNPEVKNIKATAVANENLEIALDNYYDNGAAIDTASSNASLQGGVQGSKTLNDYTWGNMVDVTNQMSTGSGFTGYKFELRPAEYKANTGLQTYEYGTDGRIDKVKALTDSAFYGGATSKSVDNAITSATQVNGVARVYAEWGSSESAYKTDYAFKVVYWLRTNKTGNIVLSTATGRADGADSSDLAPGDGSYIKTSQYDLADTPAVDKYPKEAIHVAFKVTPDSGTATWVGDTAITYAKLQNGGTAESPTYYADRVGLAGTIIPNAEPNKAYKVEMYVFLNGDVVTNAMAEEAINDIAVNVQFDNDAIAADGAMKY